MSANRLEDRLNIRVRPDTRARIQQAADVAHVPVSDFVREAAERRAAEVLAEHERVTSLPVAVYEALVAALDAPTVPNDALRQAAARAHNIVVRD